MASTPTVSSTSIASTALDEPAVLRDPEAVKRALEAGHLTVPDPQTGYHRSMYADCPNGHAAGVHRIVRMHRPAISELSMRCATCGAEFTASVDEIYLR